MSKKNGVSSIVDVAAETTGQAARDARYEFSVPFRALIKIRGAAMLLLHRYDPAEVEVKANAQKGSRTKKTDNVESYVDRDAAGNICIPGVNLKACLREAGGSFPDPRSKRKMSKDLIRAGIFVVPELMKINGGVKEWEFLDKRGVCVQMSRVTRVRPGFKEGWTLEAEIRVGQPEHISPAFLERLIRHAGDFEGLGDFRPDYGRFTVASIEFLPI